MSNYGITKENIINSLPSVLSKSPKLNALADVIADELEQSANAIDSILVYKNISDLPNELLNILAYDFKVDWWDSDLSLEEKRRILKSSWHTHRILGTRYAVESSIENIYEDCQLLEWFEYDGNPYYFKMVINSGEGAADLDKLEKVISRVIYYKSLRSYFEKIQLIQKRTSSKRYIGLASYGGNISKYTAEEFDPSDLDWLSDEDNISLIDEAAVLLFL